MRFVLPGQLKGPECRRVISQAVVLRRQLEVWFEDLPAEPISELAIVLRVDGSLGSFGQPGLENIELLNGKLECDLVIADHGWASRSDEEILQILADEVLIATTTCLRHYKVDYDGESLRKLFEMVT